MPWWDKYIVDSNRSLASCDWHGLTGVESFVLGSQSTVHLGTPSLYFCSTRILRVTYHRLCSSIWLLNVSPWSEDCTMQVMPKYLDLCILYIYILTHLPCIKWHMRLRRGAHLFPSLHYGPQLLHGLAGAQWTHELGLLQLKNNGSYLPVIPSWWSHSASHFS